MNEFIVWDERAKQLSYDLVFINFSSGGCGFWAINSLGERKIFNSDIKDVKIMKDIGKTDINDKKIYADCSILDMNDGVGTIGYFTYSKEELRYVFKCLNNSIVEVVRAENWSVLKMEIIDTIQENKLGLIK